MTPPLGKKNKCVCERRRGREERRKGRIAGGEEAGRRRGGMQGEDEDRQTDSLNVFEKRRGTNIYPENPRKLNQTVRVNQSC